MDPGNTALVTGGCGFLGTHLATKLARRGLRVFVVDLLPWPDDLIESARLDVTSFTDCLELVRMVDPQIVFHLAASSTIDSAFSDPRGSLNANVVGTMNVLEAARTACSGLTRFVLASTDKVYGELVGDGYVESMPLNAHGTYDVGKMTADAAVQLYGYEFGLPVTTLRLCNVFGPGDPHNDSRIVPRTLSRLFDPAGPLPPVIYEGSMGHGRDYVYVTDAVRALMAVAGLPQARGEVFNMVPAAHRTTLDLVEELIEQSRVACEPRDRDRADGIARNRYEVVAGPGLRSVLVSQHCDATKLRALGFANQVSMSEGLRRTIDAFVRERAADEALGERCPKG